MESNLLGLLGGGLVLVGRSKEAELEGLGEAASCIKAWSIHWRILRHYIRMVPARDQRGGTAGTGVCERGPLTGSEYPTIVVGGVGSGTKRAG